MSRPLASLLLVITTMLWGFAFIAQKSAMDAMGPLTFAAARYLLGGIAILPLALYEYRRRGRPLTASHWGWIVVMSVVFFFGSWLQQAGLIVATVTNGGFLTSLYVLFVPLIALLVLRTWPHPIVWACVPVALLGLYLLNGASLSALNSGDLLIIGSAVFWALHVLLLGFLARATNLPVTVSAISFLIAGLLAGGLSLGLETPTLSALSEGWVQIAYAGLASTAIAYTLQAVAQQYVPPANAAIILSAESLFAALGGALILGERLALVGYLGAALIFAAIIAVETVPILARRRQALPAG